MRVLVATCLLTVVLLTLGCADLIIKDDDGIPAVAGKVFARVILCAVTLCGSEFAMGDVEPEKQRHQLRTEFINLANSGIGKKSYDDALRGFGPPTRVTQGTEVLVATWESVKTYQDSDGTAFDIYGDRVRVPGRIHSKVDRTTFWFNPKTKLMTSWRVEFCNDNVCETFP